MRPDFYKRDDREQYRKKKSKSSEHKEKKSNKIRTKQTFQKYVQDFIDNRNDVDYNIDS